MPIQIGKGSDDEDFDNMVTTSAYTKINKLSAYSMIKNRLEMERQKHVDGNNRSVMLKMSKLFDE